MPFESEQARRRSRVPGNGGTPVLTAPHGFRGRMAQALVLVLTTALMVAPMPATAYADDLEDLREQAEQAATELEEATDRHVERQGELEDAQEELVGTLHELQQTEVELGEMREPLARLANTLYRQPDGGMLQILVDGSLDDDLQMQSYAAKLSEDNQALIQDATDLREEQASLAVEAQQMQTDTQLEQAELAAEVEQLRDQSEESTELLTSELEDRGLDPGTFEAAADCDESAAGPAEDYPNGLLPDDALCQLYDEDQFLRADAAVAFLELNMEYVEEFGENMCITSAYRDLPNQHRVYAEQPPGFAATPGTSNHGYGQAIDLGCGIQNFRSERWNWMEENGARYDWIHPDWAKNNPFEPWHWEYEP
ncbi:D-alanyl-D-alanine carboxypeptidase family protein [Nocardiopsis coralli]|nr:D-alanyl-D-alanine carboxypeptidase family protein [Nocardiopsis coralli]